MLKEILNAFAGSIATTSYSIPSSHGIQNVSGKQTFKNFFSTFTNSLGASTNPMFPPVSGGAAVADTPAANAYRNVQAQFTGQVPGQFISHNAGNVRNKKGRALPPGLLVPGAVIINTGTNQFIPQQQQFQGSPSPIQALVNVGAPQGLQGSAIQNGSTQQGGFPLFAPNGNGPVQPQFQQSYAQGGIGGTAIGSLLSTVIMPIISLFGVIKSLFQVRRFLGSASPARVNPENLSYNQYQGYLDDVEASEEGSFDDYSHYLQREESILNDGSDVSKLETF